MPMPFARFDGPVISATYANAVEIFPAMAPPASRAANSIHKESANPSQTYAPTAPVRLAISTGRRPIRSLSRPQRGAARNWVNE